MSFITQEILNLLPKFPHLLKLLSVSGMRTTIILVPFNFFRSYLTFLILHQVIISKLEPIIDSLFEDDELFAQEFEEDGLNRVLFIKKIGIYVEVSLVLLHRHQPF